MGTKTTWVLSIDLFYFFLKKDPQTWGRKPLSPDLFPFVCCIKKIPKHGDENVIFSLFV